MENLKAGDKTQLRFKITETSGKPASGLNLDLTAIRNYSGQVKKEHNGPRTPDMGPFRLEPAANPGEYQASLTFPQNGHWILKVRGAVLNGESAQFRQPVAVEPNTNSGVNLDWLLWPGLLILVLLIVGFVRNGGERFPVPTGELEPALVPAEGGR